MIKVFVSFIAAMSVLTAAITPNDINNVAGLFKSTLDNYEVNPLYSPETLASRDGAKKTLFFTTKSKFHEHIVSVDVQARDNKLSFTIYNTKSKPIAKDIVYKPNVLQSEMPAVKELIYRMVEKPRQNVSFTMVEDILNQAMNSFSSLVYSEIDSGKGVKLILSSMESNVAIFDIELLKSVQATNPSRSDHSLKTRYAISVENNRPFDSTFSFSMYQEKGPFELINVVKSTQNTSNYFNNLCEVVEIYKSVMADLDFKDIEQIQEHTESGPEKQHLSVLMRFYKSYVVTRFSYNANEGPVGTYTMKVYKVNSLVDDEFKIGEETIAELSFTRHSIKGLRELFKGNSFVEKLDQIHLEILKKFKEVYALSYGISHEKSAVSADIKTNGRWLFNKNRTVDMIAKGLNESNELCRLEYHESSGTIKLTFVDNVAQDRSTYEFLIDEYDMDIIGDYIYTIVLSSHGYRKLVSDKSA